MVVEADPPPPSEDDLVLFSAGFFDVFINWGISTKPWLLIPVGLAFGAIYYVVFRFAIIKWNLPTPGREPEEEVEDLTKA